MFRNCQNLKLLDLRNIYLSSVLTNAYIFSGINSNLTVCLDDDNSFFSQLLSSSNNNCSCYLNPEH